MNSCRLQLGLATTHVQLAQQLAARASLQPVEQPLVILIKMHGRLPKRGRSEPHEETNSSTLQAWVRMTLKAMMIISRCIQHRIQHHLRVPGPRGVLARQILEMGELLETLELDRVVTQLAQDLSQRSLREVGSRSPTPSDWSRVNSTNNFPLTPASRPAPRPMCSTPRRNLPEDVPPTPERQKASMWDIPADLNLSHEIPNCRCSTPIPATLWVSKTEKNPDRLFWKCSRGRSDQCSFFQWLEHQPLRPDLQVDGNLEYYIKRKQELCSHSRTTRAGTNAFTKKERCVDCGKLLVNEKTKLAAQTKKEDSSSSAAPSTPQTSQGTLPRDAQEFHAFLMWRQSQQAETSSPPPETRRPQRAAGSSSRGGLFM